MRDIKDIQWETERSGGVLTIQLEFREKNISKFETVDIRASNYRDAMTKYKDYKPIIGWRKVGHTYTGRL